MQGICDTLAQASLPPHLSPQVSTCSHTFAVPCAACTEQVQLAQRGTAQAEEENVRLHRDLRAARAELTAASAALPSPPLQSHHAFLAAAAAPTPAPAPTVSAPLVPPSQDVLASSTMVMLLQQQGEALKRQLVAVTARLVARDAKARQYKEGVRTLKVGRGAVWAGVRLWWPYAGCVPRATYLHQ